MVSAASLCPHPGRVLPALALIPGLVLPWAVISVLIGMWVTEEERSMMNLCVAQPSNTDGLAWQPLKVASLSWGVGPGQFCSSRQAGCSTRG